MATASLCASTLSLCGFSLNVSNETVTIFILICAFSLVFGFIAFIRGLYK